MPLLASLLSLPVGDGYQKLNLTPEQLKEQTGDALVAMSPEEAERQPLLEVWEDVHWADPSTLDLLGQLIDQVPNVPLLTVLTFRPEFTPPWPGALACPALDPQPARTAAVAEAITADPNATSP